MFEKYLTKTGRLSAKQPQEIKNAWYIQKFQEVHGNTYDYSKVVYSGALTKIGIICKEHGCFFQIPSNHLKGQGCPQCSGSKKKNTEECIQDFTQVHGNTYDYSKVAYINTATKVEIICKEHGSFFQPPNNHLKGVGCPKCQTIERTKTTEDCVQDFIQVHGNTYDYSRVEYSGTHNKVEIICKEHSSFLQTPNNHLIKGQGCPKCQNHNQDTLYILRCLNTGLIKVGITNNLRQRLQSIGGSLEYIHHVNMENPRELENQLHEKYQKHNVFNPTVRSGGTEFFNLSDSQVQEIEEIINNVGTITT